MSWIEIVIAITLLQCCISLNVKINSKTLRNPIFPQPTWGLFVKKDVVTLLDIITVLGRIDKRKEFYDGAGYKRPSVGLLTKEMFFENIQKQKFRKWPIGKNGKLLGLETLPASEIQIIMRDVAQLPVSEAGSDAIFTSFAKGAENGQAFPQQVDEEMKNWYQLESKTFDLYSFQLSLLCGKLYVALGWFLYIGLQFGGVYVVFFVPIMSQFFPNVDFYPIQTYLHTSEWGK